MDELVTCFLGADGPRPCARVRILVDRMRDSAAARLGRVLDRIPRNGWGTEQVIHLLGRLNTRGAYDQLVRVLVEWPFDMSYRATTELERAGARAIGALLARFDEHPEELACTLAICASGTGHPRVRDRMRHLIRHDLEVGSHCAARFGDVTLVDDIMNALARSDAQRIGPAAIVEATQAVWRFGIDPGPLGRRRLAEVGW